MAQRRRVRVDGYESSGSVQAAEPVLDEPAAAEPEACNCPHLDFDEWDEVESDWSDIAFVKMNASALLGVVTGIGKLRGELLAKADKLGLHVAPDAMLLLGPGQFRRPALLEVEGATPGMKGVARPGGIAYTRLVVAPPGKVRAIVSQAKEEAHKRYGRSPDDTWLWYLTCRVCSEERNFETLIVAHYRQAPGRN